MNGTKLAEDYFRQILRDHRHHGEMLARDRQQEDLNAGFWALAIIEAYEGTRLDLRDEYEQETGWRFDD